MLMLTINTAKQGVLFYTCIGYYTSGHFGSMARPPIRRIQNICRIKESVESLTA